MEMKSLFNGAFNNLTVLLTGHTGFKGSWLTIWLKEMGANVIGFSLKDPPTTPNNYEISKAGENIIDIRGDIRDYDAIQRTILQHRPSLVIHFAAQTTVLHSYENPKISFDTNVGGTVNVLEAIRNSDSVRATIICATDKVYENREWVWGYRENDRLGGHDPYSTSKAMAELAVKSYRQSFFGNVEKHSKNRVMVGSVRSGNVLGGGDFTENGLLADCMRSLMLSKVIPLRNPGSIRPWLFVLEPLSGYLWLAAKLLREDGYQYVDAWNFGPLQHKGITTKMIVERLIANWGSGSWEHIQSNIEGVEEPPHETNQLHLNWDKAASLLNWRPTYTIDEGVHETIQWYKAYADLQDMKEMSIRCIDRYTQAARSLLLDWTAG